MPFGNNNLPGPGGPPGPQGSGAPWHNGGSGSLNPDGSIHYTDYGNGFNTSWDEKSNGAFNIHSKLPDLGVIIQHPNQPKDPG